MPRRAHILLVATWACGDAAFVPVPELSASDALFLLQTDADGRISKTPVGPFDPSTLPTDWVVEEAHALYVVALDRGLLLDRLATYDDARSSELSLQLSSPELAGCGAAGSLEGDSALVFPLEEVLMAAHAWRLAGDAARFELAAPPAGLALRLPARVCDAGPRLQVRPFAKGARVFGDSEERWSLGPIVGLDALDADRLLLFGTYGLALVTRGEDLVPELDVAKFSSVLPVHDDQTEWHATSGALLGQSPSRAVFEIVVAFTRKEWRDGRSYPPRETGGALLVYELGVDERLRLAATYEIESPQERSSIMHVLREREGGYTAVGAGLIVTSTAARASARTQIADRFTGRRVLAPGGEGQDHVLLGESAQVYEGDPRAPFDPARVHAIDDRANIHILSGTRLANDARTPLAGLLSGEIFARRAFKDWRTYPLSLPLSASACSTRETTCGRRPNGSSTSALLGWERGGGVLVGLLDCTGLLWRRDEDDCASAIALSELDDIRLHSSGGVSALIEHEGRTYAAVGESFVYELEVVSE